MFLWFNPAFYLIWQTKSVSGTATEANLGMCTFERNLKRNKNDLTCRFVCGLEASWTEFTLPSSGLRTPDPTVWPTIFRFLKPNWYLEDLMVTLAEIQFWEVCIFRHFSKDIFWLWHWFYIEECYLVDVPKFQATMVSSTFLLDHHWRAVVWRVTYLNHSHLQKSLYFGITGPPHCNSSLSQFTVCFCHAIDFPWTNGNIVQRFGKIQNVLCISCSSILTAGRLGGHPCRLPAGSLNSHGGRWPGRVSLVIRYAPVTRLAHWYQ